MQEQSIDFSEIVEFINYSGTTKIIPEPIKSQKGRWSIYACSHEIHEDSYPFKIVYFYAGASSKDIDSALREINNEKAHVVYYPSTETTLYPISKKIEDLKHTSNKVKNVWNSKQYLSSFIKKELDSYISKLPNDTKYDYIDPKVDTPSGVLRQTPNPLYTFLTDPSTESISGKLAILLAEPGQGKTYMCHHLVNTIRNNKKVNFIPLIVESTQWNSLDIEDQKSIFKTITHSFKYFDSQISWLDGHEDQFVRLMLKANIFRIIFDGFDEYILRNKEIINPFDVLNSLTELAKSTGTRIIITSRTTFWQENLPKDELTYFSEKNGLIYEIKPFDREKAKAYFDKKLKTEDEKNLANSIYRVLNKEIKELAGRGFVLNLIADLAERKQNSDGELKLDEHNANDIGWLVHALCEREVRRHGLKHFSASQQIESFQLIAEMIAQGEDITTKLLEDIISQYDLTKDLLRETIEKLKIHPLLEKYQENDQWMFKQEQVYYFLLSKQLLEWSHKKSQSSIEGFLEKSTIKAGAWQDIGAMILSKIIKSSTDEINSIIEIIHNLKYNRETRQGHKLASIIALYFINKELPQGSSHKDKSNLLLKLSGGDKISNMIFSGNMKGYDFTNTHFLNCEFSSVFWENCEFSSNTIFDECSFFGQIMSIKSVNVGKPRFTGNCILDPDAKISLENIKIQEGEKQYSRENLKSDMSLVLDKFHHKERIQSVEENNLCRGAINSSKYRNDIIDTLNSVVFEKHSISGRGNGYNIMKNSINPMKFYISNNVFTGTIQDVYEELCKKLGINE